MPALWSPKDLAVRFAPYIEELHDVFAMHGLHYGAPENMCELAAKLDADGPLNEEAASLVRSMVLREGGSIPRTDLLEILAIAIAGPHMDTAGEELHQPVRQLLAFLHSALRRPWNEPPGEERLHPPSIEEDARAQAARELREAAAKLEAEVQNPADPQNEQIAATARANIIPFGRARAVFSKLAREDEAEFAEAPQAAPTFTVGMQAPPLPNRAVGVAEAKISPQKATVVAQPAPAVAQDQDASFPLLSPSPWELAAELSALQRNGELPSTASRPTAVALPNFDEEPPLPATPRLTRFALASGVAAAVLLVGVLGVALHAGAGAQHVDASQESAARSPNIRPVPVAAGLAALTPNSKPDPAVTSTKRGAHFDDDYVAAPYSTPPPQSASSTQPATLQVPGEAPANPAVIVRPRDPDGLAVGDARVHTTEVAVEEPPVHPRVPAAVMAMNLIAAPRPDFPMLAKLAHVDGPVIMHAEIGRSGSVVDTDVISGHHLLRHAAEDAVKHWRYKPYEVGGRAVPVSTIITVRFRH